MWMQLIFHTLRLSLLFLLVAAHQYLGPRTKQLCSKYKISSQIIIVNIFPSRRNQLRSHPLLVERLWLWMERSCSRFLRMRSRSVRWRKRWIIVNHSFLQILSFQIVLVDLFCERHIHPHNYTCSMGLYPHMLTPPPRQVKRAPYRCQRTQSDRRQRWLMPFSCCWLDAALTLVEIKLLSCLNVFSWQEKKP